MSIDRHEAKIEAAPVTQAAQLSGDMHAPKIQEMKGFNGLAKNVGQMSHDDLGAAARSLASSGQDLGYYSSRAAGATGMDGESKERMQKMAALAINLQKPGDMRLAYHY